ncbi:DMT family transporter [Gymnodinialimonas ceratoperidinii]|uniref:DMT family transporter n=1 Tax=Gymnodinialimonas ceratoperidinii TaxID=2856823 RepID=A0A8F6YBP1_9RHOB|nr:DMT family transporter [Gymnodinialimonas ceratoperidinii]QXT38395.1 DMT family transporter [Gymnodinialimonas ceratoperidinii]
MTPKPVTPEPVRPDPVRPEAPASNIPKAAGFMAGAIVAFSAMAVAGREVVAELDTFELMTYRSIVGLILVVLIGGLTGRLGEIRTDRMPTHIFRNIFHFLGQNLWFFAVGAIPLAQVFALEFTAPLWVIIFAALFLGERLTVAKIASGLIGFIGILIVVQPGAVPFSLGMAASLGAAVSFAITAIFTKRLTRDQSIMGILFWLTTIQLVLGLAFCLYDGEIALPSLSILPLVVLIGLCGLVAHFCMTSAFSCAPASVVMPIDFARLPLIAIVGMTLYNEPLQLAVFAGAVLIFGANYMNILTEHRRSRRQV